MNGLQYRTCSVTMSEMKLRAMNEVFPGNIYLFNVNNRNTRKRYQICSKSTIKTLEQRHRPDKTP